MTGRKKSWLSRLCCWLHLHTFTVVSSRVSSVLRVTRYGRASTETYTYETRWCPVCGQYWHRGEFDDKWQDGHWQKAFEKLTKMQEHMDKAFQCADEAMKEVFKP